MSKLMQSGTRNKRKRALALLMSCTLSLSLFTVPAPLTVQAAVEAETEGVVFKRQVGGVFDGMPLFNGDPQYLDEFVDTFFEYTGLEGPAVYVTGSRNHYTLKEGPNAGKKIPGALSAADNVQGVSTDFPALVGLGQTWNKELLAEVGEVMGSEKISVLKVKQGESNIHGGANASLSVAFTVVSDLRINPLSGRFDEGFSEDAYMASQLINSMATGLSGIDQPNSNDGFWMRAAVGTKHFSVYNAQWYRFGTSSSASPRAIFEYQTVGPMKALSTGAVAGVMTSYGMTNGIPNIISPYQRYANEQSKFGVYSSPDFNGDNHVFNTSISNGYDTSYTKDRTTATVLMALAKSNAGRPSPNEANADLDVAELVAAVRSGMYGITEEDLIEAARPHINQLVRLGIFNETDENGIPLYYPFARDAADVREVPANYELPEHQEVALKAAQESIVLLKNDGALPLDETKKAAISGMYGDARFKTTYSVGTTPNIENAGDSPLLSIIKRIGSDNVHYDLGGKVIALTSAANGEVVTADPDANLEEGAQLITTSEPLDTTNHLQLFRVIDLGQNGINLLSLANNRFVTSPSGNPSNPNNLIVGNTDATPLNLTNNDWNLAEMNGNTSTIPPRLRMERNEDGTLSFISNGYRSGFSGEFTDWYYTNGRIVTVEDGKLVVPTTPLGNAQAAANRSDAVKFQETVVKEVGEDAVLRAEHDDYAIVFIGAIPRHSAGEGYDRSTIYMGEDDYELVDKVADAFAEQGKKTIVVVKSSFPVGMEEIQSNPNVSAIVYQPYGGQYDSYALAQVLYGDYAPTGRLTSTWYADMSAFEPINDYVIPASNPNHQLGVNIDPRYTVDMTNADPVAAKLTYMYTAAPITYEFGYGLSYSDFQISNLQAPNIASSQQAVNISVDVENVGAVDTAEVIQVYVHNNDSAYGEASPIKKLVGFEKVQLAAGEQKTVQISVNPQDFGIWDVNKGDFIVEDGTYTLLIGTSSNNIVLEKQLQVQGDELATLQGYSAINVVDHTFNAHNVKYYEVSKQRTAENLKDKLVVGGYYAVGSKGDDSWTAIPKVDLTGAKSVQAKVASNGQGGLITLHADSLDQAPFAVINVPATAPVSYTIDSADVTVNELGYTDVEVALSDRQITGVHDVYVAFHAVDLRMDELSFETASVIASQAQLQGGSKNPQLVIETGHIPFAAEATDLTNWTFDAKNSGLTIGAITLDATNMKATLQLEGTARSSSSLSLAAKAAAFAGSALASNELTISIRAASQNGPSLPDPEPEAQPEPTPTAPAEPSSETAKLEIRSANETEQGQIANIQAAGIKVAGEGTFVTKLAGANRYESVELKLNTAQGVPTALVRVNSDGSLTPVPSKLVVASDGGYQLQAVVASSGLYVPVTVSRSFRDVASTSWYAPYIADASSLLLMNGVSSTSMKPMELTTRAHVYMVALNMLGLSPEKQSSDKLWYDSVNRTITNEGLKLASHTTLTEEVTRQEIAAITQLVLQHANIPTELTTAEVNQLLASYNDADQLTATERASLALMVKYGIYNGKSSSSIAPHDQLTRAELATIALRTRQAILEHVLK